MDINDYKDVGIILLVMSLLTTLIVIFYVFPIIEQHHPSYNKTVIDPEYGMIEPYIRCPVCNSTNLEPFESDISDDDHNKKILTFFYCRNCSTIFSLKDKDG